MMDMMGRKIKYALQMRDGTDVRTIEDLRKHFNLPQVAGYFLDGKLVEWLRDRHYEETANEIEKLKENLKKDDPDLGEKLCTALGVKVEYPEPLDIPAIDARIKKEDKVSQRTRNPLAKAHLDALACNQRDLELLLAQGVTPIYLLGKGEGKTLITYVIPLARAGHRTFIGIEDTYVTFDPMGEGSQLKTAVEKQGIRLEHIHSALDGIQDDGGADGLSLAKKFVQKVSEVPNSLMHRGDVQKEKDKVHLDGSRGRNVQMRKEKDSVSTVKNQLVRYLDAGFPIIYLETFEEDKVGVILESVAGGRNILEWSAQGLSDKKNAIRKDGWSLSDTLLYLIRNQGDACRSVIVLKDAHDLLKDPLVVARLKKFAQLINAGKLEDTNVVIVSPITVIPHELENYLTLVHMGHLSSREIRKIIQDFCKGQNIYCENAEEDAGEEGKQTEHWQGELDEQLLNDMVQAFKGLSEFEIGNILALALSSNGEINRDDLALIREQKRQMIQKSGILEMVEVREKKEDIGGLATLQDWLERKAKVFKNIKKATEFGVDIPKGVLIVGMPGCGKSLCAKVTAASFDMPLIRLDMGKVMGKFVGESEANMRRALNLSEAIAPCVLWVDEMEKAFSGLGNAGASSDVVIRLFGAFLTWLQENKSTVFVVATANDITKMPPELLRKGRFDDIFYIDLPGLEEREKIFRIHIAKRRLKDLDKIDLRKLALKADGFSGAGIEGVVSESVENAFAEDKEHLTTDDIENVIHNTHPLKEIMKEPIERMQKLYQERKFRNASKNK